MSASCAPIASSGRLLPSLRSIRLIAVFPLRARALTPTQFPCDAQLPLSQTLRKFSTAKCFSPKKRVPCRSNVFRRPVIGVVPCSFARTFHSSVPPLLFKGERNERVPLADSSSEESEAAHNDALIQLLRDAVGLSCTEDIEKMLHDAKNAEEVDHIVQNLVLRHHLCADPLNGHGFRVSILRAMTAVAPRTRCIAVLSDVIYRFRQLGFLLTRTFAAETFTTLRLWIMAEFEQRGRTPTLVTQGLGHLRELFQWCQEDQVTFDHVLYSRLIFLLTMMVSFMDRQNVFRSSFPPDFVKRDGVVVEWMLTPERCTDFDETVLQCDAVLEELLAQMRQDIPTRPTFGLLYRLMDYYFATDNVEKLLAVMEDSVRYGVPVAESSTAKLMQLACALNLPDAPELFLRWRTSLAQCVLATPDISRLLFYYSRSGGGHPCPICGEPYNHRHVGVYVWLETPPHQRNCAALRLGRQQKGVQEEWTLLPQNGDWSEEAWALWRLSVQRSIPWGTAEWRGFLLCCMFPATYARRSSESSEEVEQRHARAMASKALLDEHFAAAQMDDFLRATYLRFLRHHAPEQAVPTLRTWSAQRLRLSPMVLQEALMAAAAIEGAEEVRMADVTFVWEALQSKDAYVMPFTRRKLQEQLQKAELPDQPEPVPPASPPDPPALLQAERDAHPGDPEALPEVGTDTTWRADDILHEQEEPQRRGAATEGRRREMEALLMQIVESSPKSLSLLDRKDSASDFAVGGHRKNVFQG